MNPDYVKINTSDPVDTAVPTRIILLQEDQKCIPKQRPPFSYMNLILMAISDDSDRRMTLKQIYQWIEEKYPYYKYCASPSWKVSDCSWLDVGT